MARSKPKCRNDQNKWVFYDWLYNNINVHLYRHCSDAYCKYEVNGVHLCFFQLAYIIYDYVNAPKTELKRAKPGQNPRIFVFILLFNERSY